MTITKSALTVSFNRQDYFGASAVVNRILTTCQELGVHVFDLRLVEAGIAPNTYASALMFVQLGSPDVDAFVSLIKEAYPVTVTGIALMEFADENV